jgi:hypothetical protein
MSMLFRTVCLILAVVVLRGWARCVAIGIAVVLPWLAVVVANGGPPLRQDTPSLLAPGGPAADAPRPALEQARHAVIDGEVIDDEIVRGGAVDSGGNG